ncbi:MAG: hemerythrin domain-containing protein [Planctomycetaceae bacterium]
MSTSQTNSLPKSMIEEHEEVARKIDSLKRFWHQVDELGMGPKYEEMASRIHEFRDEMEQHFDEEENQSVQFSQLDQKSESAMTQESLHQQHTQLLKQLDDFSERLKQCEGVYHCWQEVRADFDRFLNALHNHEQAETDLFKAKMKQG